MGRWLVALVVLASLLAAGAVAFQSGGEPITVRLLPGRAIVLPLGVALGVAFAAGGAIAAALALGGAATRSWRGWRRRRSADRTAARLRDARVGAEALLVAGHSERAHDHLTQAVSAHGPD